MHIIWLLLALLVSNSEALGNEGKHPGRLVVADGKTGLLQVLDLEKGELVGRFTSPGPANVYSAPGGQYAFAIHREQNRVTIVYGGLGLEDHGDHKDLTLQTPYIWATVNTGPKPTHFKSHGNQIVIYNDGDGTMAVFDARKLGLVPDFREIATGAPDHGAPVALERAVLAGSLNRGVVEVFTLGGRKITEFAGCPRLHGQAVLGGTIAYGCSDGVLLVEQQGSGFIARKLPNPTGTPERVRVGTLIAHSMYPFFIGNFGQGLARIDSSIRPMPLPAAPVRFQFDRNGLLVVLTADGSLHTLEASTGKVLASLKVSEPITASGEGAVRPGLTTGDGVAFVTLPDKGEVLEVDLGRLQIKRRFNVGGNPASVAWLWVDGVRH
ncbi:hypothetical protein [Meiothermus sp. CFH 77666]|uniref:YncE family protein n=1 Tax=Meiothermus sp. CFH 77666 TaxID=2817942 RepID=UPI001AA0833D|nr:hypothetical protein [Meiothermus sp. CFH 77666]MBO1438726.1 hypothetical protein [Meiothermus sp. CFH 77666]